MSTDVFANFGALDELVQILYQSIYKFVVVSTVTDDNWTIHVGLSDSDGRWWKGAWSESDVEAIMGSKASDRLLEQFADQLAKLFVDGELYISDWNTAPGAKIKFTVGPAAKRPMHVPLEELSPSEAAEFATKVLVDIALQAKSRKCRLHGSASTYESAPLLPVASSSSGASAGRPGAADPSSSHPKSYVPRSEHTASKSNRDPSDDLVPRPVKPSHLETVERQASILEKASLVDKASEKKRAASSDKPASAPKPRPHKGASLANPNKKARKIQTIEFESDSE